MSLFSDRLKELRKSKGVTQKAMAEYLGMVERAYQDYEYGKLEPNHEKTIKLADYFDVTLDYLTGRSDDPDVLNITPHIQTLLSDSRLSFDAKGLYMQLQLYALDNKATLPNEEIFLIENKVTKQEFDNVIGELESLGYLQTETTPDEKTSKKIYLLT